MAGAAKRLIKPAWWNDAAAASHGPAKTTTRLRAPPAIVAVDAAPRRRARAEPFARARFSESTYATRLRALARQIDEIVVQVWDEEDPARSAAIASDTLRRYASTIEPWARAVARRMLSDVSARDAKAWRDHARAMGGAIREEFLGRGATAALIRKRMDEQIELITSLPIKAAERVHAMTREGLATGERWEAIAEKVLATGRVTRSRANLIARTEVGRAASEITRERGEYIGSDGYIWRTAHDADVRELHRRLEGTFHRWDDPPVSGERGERSAPGAIYNCRCWAEPVLPRVA